jgi:uncharacterized delta-60 repeat protein
MFERKHVRYLLIGLLVFVLAACSQANDPQPIPDPNPIPEPVPNPEPGPNPEPNPNPTPEPNPNPEPNEPNGTLDETFGTKGLVVYGSEGNSETANDAVLLPDGTIVVVGSRRDNSPEASEGDVSLVLFFNPNGTLKSELTFPDSDADVVAVQENGEVIIAGRGTNPATNEFVFWLRRLKVDGTLDTSFGEGGVVYTTQSGFLADMVLDDAGRIILGGAKSREVGRGDVIQLLRFTPEGEPDETFGEGNGVVTTDIEQDSRLNALTLDAQGRLVAVGFTRTLDVLNGIRFLVLRYDGNGKPDTFGPIGQGFNIIDFGDRGEEASAVALDKAGRILAAGGQSIPSSIILTGLGSDGFPDETFGSKNGKAIFGFGTEAQGLAIDSKGRILIAGIKGSVVVEDPQAPPRGNEELLAVRLDAQGNLDKSYGSNGGRVVKLELPDTNVLASIEAALLDKQEGFIFVGRRLNLATEDNDIILTRIR